MSTTGKEARTQATAAPSCEHSAQSWERRGDVVVCLECELPAADEIEAARAVLERDFRTYGREAARGAWRDADTNPAIAYELGRRDGARAARSRKP